VTEGTGERQRRREPRKNQRKTRVGASRKKKEAGAEGRRPKPALFPVFASSRACGSGKFFVPSPSIFNYLCTVQSMWE